MRSSFYGGGSLLIASKYASTVRSAAAETRRLQEGMSLPELLKILDFPSVQSPLTTNSDGTASYGILVYISVVVDMLTWFMTAIPTKTMFAEETLAALMEHVFTKCFLPLVIKFDNDYRHSMQLSYTFHSSCAFIFPRAVARVDPGGMIRARKTLG
eukprot:6214526-Pleurochrysis_carterae.AAC.1